MKPIFGVIVTATAALFATAAAAISEVDIVYPIDGATYPIMDPAPGTLSSHYFTASFRVTCDGGPHDVSWGFGGGVPFATLGKASFYDQTSVQFVHKLPGGAHYFEVKSDCGTDAVKFKIGN